MPEQSKNEQKTENALICCEFDKFKRKEEIKFPFIVGSFRNNANFFICAQYWLKQSLE